MALKGLGRIEKIPRVVLLHQAVMLDHGVLNGSAFQHGDVHVVGILQPETATRQRSHPTEVAQLGGTAPHPSRCSAAVAAG